MRLGETSGAEARARRAASTPNTSAGRGASGVLAVVFLLVVTLLTVPQARAADDPCGPGGNPVACENSKLGDAPSQWDIEGAGDATIQGFATAMSVTPGETVRFKIKASAGYTVDVYRLGYYGGQGARRQAPRWAVSAPVSQPACATDASTHNYDCGTWSVSTQWTVPGSAVSGVYVAKLSMGTDYSHITFVVRNDASTSDVLFKTSDATWQAYNNYGGASFYSAPQSLTGTQARAFKVSYNRPFATRGKSGGRDFLFSNEYPTLRFLEANGIDVSYTTDVDLTAGTTVLTRHKAFLSVGHDEYWSLAARNRVEAARDAGVNLAFLSGNEVYWATSSGPSIDGSATAHRTLICYKDSWEPSQISPPGEATPTWRDPAYGAPRGSRPENALTGTAYMSNFTDLAITVSAEQGKARLWRHTDLAALPSGGSAQLAPHSIGYESDEDIDNGHRPAGLMRLSETTGPTEQLVQNLAGTIVKPGTTIHSLTLYRAASGALVFGAGTINWGWGLDQYHDGDNSNPADTRMQQATLNLLADMGSLPVTLRPGLTMPAASADVQAPSVTVTTPSANATLGNGTGVTVTGSAEDTGGVVTNVEVSLDGGATYHRATGTTSWAYTGNLTGVGASSIRVRATDDSANLSSPTTTPVTVTCPCSLFGSTVPTVAASSDSSSVEVGVKFRAEVDGFVSGIRFFKGASNTGTHVGTLWSAGGSALAVATFTGESASGWQTAHFSQPLAITAGTTYVASYHAPVGRYSADAQFFTTGDHRAAPLTAPGRPSGVLNGVYSSGHQFPTQSFKDTNYWVDVVFSRDDTTPPSIATTSPQSGASSVATTAKPSATFVGTVDPASVTLVLRDAAETSVPGTMTFDVPSRTARFTPSTALTKGATYRATVNAMSGAGTPMPSPHTWSFTVALSDPLPGVCPCSIWPDSATPAVANGTDARSVQVGVKFTADVEGTATGVRFYKGSINVGTHTGSIWTAAGVLLGSVTFTNETSSGWQTAYFTTPVDLEPATTYIVSYAAPNGAYSVTTSGLAAAVNSGPLHTVAGGGVYSYGTGAPLSSSTSNYWVDLVFMAGDAAPTVAKTAPVDTATNVHIGSRVSATLNGQVQEGTAQMTLRDATGAAVAGTTTYAAATRTASFAPALALSPATTYTATVSGATALSGSRMEPYSWLFTTAGGACPCTLFDSHQVPSTVDGGDKAAVEVGVSFTSSVGGQVTGVRFYKSTLNTGVHVGNLWSSSGTRLATGTFTGESATGWQTLTFPSPVAVTAGTTYVASYHAPQGRYSVTSQFFASPYINGVLSAATSNGRYRYASASAFPTATYGATNYWVDPIFAAGAPPDVTPPAVQSVSPLDGSTSQSVGSSPTVTFTEDIDPATLIFTLRTSSGDTVGGTIGYDAAARRATLTPTAQLAQGAVHTASARASDRAGNPMASDRVWSFTTAQPDPVPGVCPCSLWTDSTEPTRLSDPDSVAIELGTAFRTDADGGLTGVRFYKGPTNTGTHTVSLWTATGTRLTSSSATSESTTGWQTVQFPIPVPVTAGVTYVVSYLAPNGQYSSTANGLATALDRAPLRTVSNAGRYVYGSGFPVNASSTSYLVDPVYMPPTPAADTTAPLISDVVVSGSGSSRTVTWTTNEASTSVVQFGTSADALTSEATGTSGTNHSVTLSGLAGYTTYYLRVTSEDGAANSATSPAASASPLTLATGDTTPPGVFGLSARGSGTSMLVEWTTDEVSTTSIAYGSSATALTSAETGASGTSHSLTVSGLAPHTRYYYRVTSADAAGNSSTFPAASAPPAEYVPEVVPVTFTTVNDFSSGTGGYVGDGSGGELLARPAAGYELTGSTVPSGLVSTALVAGGSTSLAAGRATVSGAQLATGTEAPGTTMSTATVLAPGQAIGWSQTADATSGVRAVFRTSNAGALSAELNDGTTTRTTAIPGTWTSAAHEYRVDWLRTGATFSVDGVQVATAAFSTKVALRAALVDLGLDGSPLVCDWLRIGPYAASSTFVGAVMDAGATVGWDSLARDVLRPVNTAVTIEVRSGNTPAPGSGWTAWSSVPPDTGSLSRSARYLQYRVISSTSGNRFATPQTRSLTFVFHVL